MLTRRARKGVLEREKVREGRGHIVREHWPGAVLRAVCLQESAAKEEGERRGGGKPAVAHIPAPAQCWSDGPSITMSPALCPSMPAPSHTHNKHTPSPAAAQPHGPIASRRQKRAN